MNYYYTNTSTTNDPPIVWSRWEVRDSQDVLLAVLDDPSQIDFTYAFPYLDIFTVKLSIRDSSMNEDSETKTYIVDKYPCQGQGGGGPAIPQLIENKAAETMGEVTLVGMNDEDGEMCKTIIKATKVMDVDADEKLIIIKAKLSEKK